MMSREGVYPPRSATDTRAGAERGRIKMFECKSDGHCENECPYFMECDWIREQIEDKE